MKAVIFDIKRYAVHDGPGIRTSVFFKGCPLSCQWCHNPEGAAESFELIHRPERCAHCYACLVACLLEALSKDASGAVAVNRAKCDVCGKCEEACLYEAMQVVGREVTLEEVVAEIEKDRIFYDQSGGGVTLTGGEPLVQHEFVEALLNELRSRSIHTALDTSGFVPPEVFERTIMKTDLVLFDLKLMDEPRHEQYTGVSNRLILDNLKRLAASGREINIRIPLVAGVNDDDDNINRTVDFLTSLNYVRAVNILPYHQGGIGKSKRLGKESLFRPFSAPSDERVEEVLAVFQAKGFVVKKGG